RKCVVQVLVDGRDGDLLELRLTWRCDRHTVLPSRRTLNAAPPVLGLVEYEFGTGLGGFALASLHRCRLGLERRPRASRLPDRRFEELVSPCRKSGATRRGSSHRAAGTAVPPTIGNRCLK